MDKYTSKPVTITAEEYTGEKQAPGMALIDKKHKEATGECVILKGFNDKGKHRPMDTLKHWFTKKDLKTRLDKKHINYNKKVELIAVADFPSGRKFIEKGDMLVFAKDDDKKDVLVDVIKKDEFKLKFEKAKAK